MDRIVSNATPLIYLAKANQLILLQTSVNQVLIPQSVYREVVTEGKRLGVRDAYRIENAVISGWLVVKDVINRFPVKITIHPGEADVISLAKENKIEKVLMDDAKARTAAELAGLQAVGTLWLLLRSLKTRRLDFDGFLTTLEDIIRAGFYLKDDVYLRVVRMAREITDV